MKTNIKVCAILSIALAVSGCVIFPDLPPLPPPREVDCPKEVRLDLPPPVPDTVYIRIDGDTFEADEGGEELLRNYGATFKLIEELWHEP